MSSINNQIFQGKFLLDIALHVTILFTILSNFYIYNIYKVSNETLNEHLKTIINTYFIDNNNSIVNYIKNNNLINSNILINNNLIKNNKLINNDTITNLLTNNKLNINDTTNLLTHLNYYNTIYSNQDITRKLVNQQIFKKIINANILLIIITILFAISLLVTKSITYTDIKHLLFENIVSFTIIGIIEYLFFTQIAIKFVPSPPSHIIHSLIKYLQN